MKSKNTKKRKSKTSLKLAGFVVRAMAVIILITSIVISVYLFIFLIFAMMPTIVSVMIDKRIGKGATNTIGAFNMSGLLPFIKSMMESNNVDMLAQNLITDVFVWFFVYGAAGIGWIIIWSVPQIVSVFYIAKAQQKIEDLKKEQERLIDEWGGGVIKNQ